MGEHGRGCAAQSPKRSQVQPYAYRTKSAPRKPTAKRRGSGTTRAATRRDVTGRGVTFGTLSTKLVLSNGLSIVLMSLFGLTTMTYRLRLLVLRGWPLLRAGMLACVAAAPTMVLAYLSMLATQSVFPAFCILDPHEPRTVSFHVLTALADSLPFVAAWGTFLFLPSP
jgi:hypothetical protein